MSALGEANTSQATPNTTTIGKWVCDSALIARGQVIIPLITGMEQR